MQYGPFDNESEAWAWAAGLFEGEGCIINRWYERATPGGNWQRSLVLGMTDEDPVRLFHQIAGAGSVIVVPPPKDKPDWSKHWRWYCSRWAETERILTRLLPLLGERRRAAAEELLANPALPHGARNTEKTHCKRGHPLSGDNIYVHGSRRTCVTCRRMRQRGYYRRDRASR